MDYHFTGYPSVLPRVGCLARLVEPGKDAIGFAALDVDFWRDPLSLRIAETRQGELLVRLPLQVYEQEWASDGFSRFSPNYTGKTLGVPDNTSRRRYGIMLTPAEDERHALLKSLFTQGAKLGAFPLDTVKDWVLDWPDPLAGAAWTNGQTAAGTNQLRMLRDKVAGYRRIGHYGQFSMGYHFHFAKGQYPGLTNVIDNPAILTAADRREMRRLCALVATDMHRNDRFPWGMGFHLNNPNMSMMAMEARIKTAMLIKDHPEFRRWGEWTLEFTRDFLRRFTKESGAPYENPHYTLGVTFADLLEVNQFLMVTGIGDALADPLFERSARFTLNWLTPPDPRFFGHRLALPYGNGSYQSVPPAMGRMIVEYFRNRNPELAGQLQWMANQTLPTNMQIAVVQDKVPPLGSLNVPEYGVFFRHGFGTPYETLFHLFAGTCDGHYEFETDQMTYTLFAKGQPLNLHFGNGYFPMICRPWARNRVSIDHRLEQSERNLTRVEAATFMPEAEYARAMRRVDQLLPPMSEFPDLTNNQWSAAESKAWTAAGANAEHIPPVLWHRQALFLKDVDPRGPNYFVLRDTFGGTPTKPTDLSLWFLAKGMEKQGAVYHFAGQCLADMDLFVNTPDACEPEMGGYRHVQQPYGRFVGFDPQYHPDGKLQETQMVFRVKQPAGKGYLVVLYPRLKENDPAATFARLNESAVKVETPLATDYAFLNSFPLSYQDDRVQFEGTAATVRFYKSGAIAVLNVEGTTTVKVAGKTITGNGAFSVTIAGGAVTKKTFGPDAAVDVK